MNLDSQGWANLIQGTLVLVTIVGIWSALIIGKRDRKTAMALAYEDRRAADERAANDRHAADERAERDARIARERIQQDFRLRQGLRLTQLLHEGRPDNPAQQNAWSVEVRTILYSLGESELPQTWAAYISNAPAGDSAAARPAGAEKPEDEVSGFLREVAREAACTACFHTH